MLQDKLVLQSLEPNFSQYESKDFFNLIVRFFQNLSHL